MRLNKILHYIAICLSLLLLIIIIFLIKNDGYFNKILDDYKNVSDSNKNIQDHHKWALENGKYFVTHNPTESHHVGSTNLFNYISNNKEHITQEKLANFIDKHHVLNEETEYTSDGKVIEGQRQEGFTAIRVNLAVVEVDHGNRGEAAQLALAINR